MNSTDRRARVEAKRHPESFEESEEVAIARDRALDALKRTPEYFAASHHFDLEQQNRGMQ
uniref:Uncharacterized protein n=1 Tax=Variovorax paradoxus (strain S110) TaxID=543728 RepID=C5CJL6_VARPS